MPIPPGLVDGLVEPKKNRQLDLVGILSSCKAFVLPIGELQSFLSSLTFVVVNQGPVSHSFNPVNTLDSLSFGHFVPSRSFELFVRFFWPSSCSVIGRLL